MNPLVRSSIAKKRGLSLPGDDGEYMVGGDMEEDKSPYESLAREGAASPEEDIPNVGSMEEYDRGQEALMQSRAAGRDANLATNLGSVFSNLATGKPQDQSHLYAQMSAQNKEADSQTAGDLTRRASVMKAIQAASAKKDAAGVAAKLRSDAASMAAQAAIEKEQRGYAQQEKMARLAAGLKTKEEKGKKIVPSSEAVSFGGANAAVSALDDVSSMVNDNPKMFGPAVGMMDKGAAYFGVGETGRNARTVQSTLEQRAQIIGKYLEGGKLTDSDIARYQKSLPQFGDSPEVAQNKIASLQRLIAQKQDAEKQALSGAGYDVAGLTGSPLRDLPRTKRSGSALSDSAAHAGDESPEVERKTKDGKVAIFDAKTKQFLRYK